MPALDLRSIALTLALSSATLALVLWVASRDRDHPIAGLRWWVAGVWMLAAGMGLNSLLDLAPDAMTRALSNALIASSTALIGCGTREFHGRSAALWWPLLVGGSMLVMSVLTLYVWPSHRWRVVLFSLLMALAQAVAGWELLRERRAHLRAAALFGSLPLLAMSVLMIGRALEAATSAVVPVALAPTPMNTLTYLAGGIVLLAGIAAMMMLVNGVRSAQLRDMAYSDALTGVLSRRGLYTRLPGWLANRRDKATVAVIDGNGFKRINDQLGHEAGDAVLRLIADGLRHAVPPTALLARFGGDEFVVLMAGDASACAAAITTARHACDNDIDARFPQFRRERPSFAWGVAELASLDAAGAAAALRAADAALYLDKGRGHQAAATVDAAPTPSARESLPGRATVLRH